MATVAKSSGRRPSVVELAFAGLAKDAKAAKKKEREASKVKPPAKKTPKKVK
jgi:hypothetical protein